MATSVVDIYNWALSAIGAGSTISLTTEDSLGAEQCNLWYENVRDQVLRSAPWSSAQAISRLAQLSVRDEALDWVVNDPLPGWQYSFAYPADMLRPRYLSNYARFDLGTNQSNQRVIYTNNPVSLLIYTKQQPRVDLWDVDLQAAVSFALAAHIAIPLTGSVDKLKIATSQAIDKIMTARSNGSNEAQAQLESPTPDWLIARGYAEVSPVSRYIYPSADFTVVGFNNVN